MNSSSSGTIDAREVAYYDKLASTWWDRQGPFWPLHRLNTLRTAWLRDHASKHFSRSGDRPRPLQGLSVLDIGCGGGILSVAMAELGADVHGIDVVERNIGTARSHASLLDSALELRFDTITAEALAAGGARYDIVLSMEVVEHVADLSTFVQSNSRLVADGGALFMSTINRTARSWLFAIVGAEYVLRWLPRGTHHWRRFPKPRELQTLLARDGLAVAETTGVAVNPISRKFRLTDDLSVNYMLMARHAHEPNNQR